MKFTGDAFLEIWDLSAIKLIEIPQRGLSVGKYNFEINPILYGLKISNYVYQLRVENSNGIFRQAKMMTAF